MATDKKQFGPDLFRNGAVDLFDNHNAYDEVSTDAQTKLIKHLQARHRELSEQIIEDNRGLIRLAVTSKEDEKAALRAHVAELQAKRIKIEAELKSEFRTLKEHQIGDNKQKNILPATVAGEVPQTERGLIRQRHPNRDFFLADLFDYAMKDDGV